MTSYLSQENLCSGLVPYFNKRKKITQFIGMNWWRNLCSNIMYFLEFGQLKHYFSFRANQIIIT